MCMSEEGRPVSYDEAQEILKTGYYYVDDRKRKEGDYYVLIRLKSRYPDPPPGYERSYHIDRRLPKREVNILKDLAKSKAEDYEKRRDLAIKMALNEAMSEVIKKVENVVKKVVKEEVEKAVEKIYDEKQVKSAPVNKNPPNESIEIRLAKIEGRLETLEKLLKSPPVHPPVNTSSTTTQEVREKEEEVELSINLEKLREGFIKATEIVTEATGRRIIADPHILLYYGFAISHLGFKGDLADFIREQIIDHHRDHGIELAFVIRKER